MARNQVQFLKGLSLPRFLKQYGTEMQCHSALFHWCWPGGFVCPDCGHTGHCEISGRSVYQCHRCHRQTSVTSGTIFEYTKLPLTIWFLGIYLLTQPKNGISALELKRQLGIGYNAAWRMKHKLLQVMKERDDGKPLSGAIQVDDAYWGGEHNGGKRGRGAEGKTPFIAAVKTNEDGQPIAMRFTELEGFRKTEIAQWAKRHLTASSLVVSDGLKCFSGVMEAGCTHQAIVTGGGPNSVKIEAFNWVNTMIGNVKNSMHGSYHAISNRHLPRYLAEFCYRFNRRFKLEDMISRLGCAAVRTPPMPQRLLSMAEARG
ncbi:MAG: IS1595 family transposase [endosymbiont of Lamellibrachia luymesi]|uniref:IS1595 family transposase n=1 Tax=endosymbiont of Lamellibrachia luymesi TaxID=2200907 RepID=A0A370DZ71_9GAMM|nr:MAG: IS1595 family transposase [endosymbiont of Lamellibrachia luymesi]